MVSLDNQGDIEELEQGLKEAMKDPSLTKGLTGTEFYGDQKIWVVIDVSPTEQQIVIVNLMGDYSVEFLDIEEAAELIQESDGYKKLGGMFHFNPSDYYIEEEE